MAYNGNGVNYSAVHSEGMPWESSSELMKGNNLSRKKGPWTTADDQILIDYVRKHGVGNWNFLQRNSGLNRCGKSCRLRWANHLRPNLKKGAFKPEEERLILQLHAKYGNKWARMASQLPGRTDNEIKNYWNTRVKKRQRKGLPLYPHDINVSQQQSHLHFHSQPATVSIPTGLTQPATTSPTICFQCETSSSQTQLPPISPTPPHHSPLSSPHQPNSTLKYSLPPFDSVTSSFSTSVPSFTFHRPTPMIGAQLGYKRYKEDIGFSPPISPTPQRYNSILRTSSVPDMASYQQFATVTSFIPDMTSFQFQPQTFYESFPPLPCSSSQFDFKDSLLSPSRSVYSMKSELPSSQVPQTPELPVIQVSQIQSLSEISIDANINAATVVSTNETNCSDGMLDELLQEAETLAFGENPRKAIGLLDSFEVNHVLDGYGSSLSSTPMGSSFLEIKPVQDHEHMNPMPEDLSKSFSFIPSTEPVSDWYGGDSRNSLISNFLS